MLLDLLYKKKAQEAAQIKNTSAQLRVYLMT